MRQSMIFIFVVGLGLFSSTGFASNFQTELYSNSKFNFSISYPVSLFKAAVESDNSDGATIEAKDGTAKLIAWGSYGPSVLNESISELYSDTLARAGSTVTYKTINKNQNFFVVSGVSGSKVFYQKTYLIGDSEKSFQIEYLKSKKNIYDSVVISLNKNFTPN